MSAATVVECRTYADIHLAATAHAASVAVMFTQSTLKSWGLDVLFRTAAPVVRTLVGHAVTAAERVDMLVLRVAHNESTLFIEVWDGSPGPPAGPAPAGHQSGYFFLDSGGKVVWTKIAYAEPHPVPLPRRTPSPVPRPAAVETEEPSQYANDADTLQRVRAALKDL